MKRGAMNSLTRARGMRFEWQKLVTPLTPKSVVADWQAKDSDIKKKLDVARSASKTVAPIDWEYWKTQISAPGVVEQMQKDYEALNFPTIDPMTAENTEKLAEIEAEVLKAEKEAVHGASEVKEADKVIAQVNKVKAEGMTWTLKQWQDFIPGLEAQHKQEYEDEEYIVSDEQLKYDSVDWKTATKEFAAGQNPDLGVPESQVGDMSLEEELALVEKGTWSVARVFAGKDERARIQDKVEKTMA